MEGGGAERIVSYLLKYLGDDYEIHLILFENKIEYDLPENQIITCLGKKNNGKNSDFVKILKIPIFSRKLLKYCREKDIDLVFSLLSRPNFASCIAKKFGLKAKVLISERIFTPLYYSKKTLQGRFASYLVSRLYPLADAILPNSHQTALALQTQYNIKNKYYVIKNLLDVKSIAVKKTEPAPDVDFSRFTFINLAGFRAQKNHRLLIEAFAELNAEDAQLLLIGKGEFATELKHLVEHLKLDDRVIFLGHQSNPFKYLGKADCFVLSSDFEGFPNVVLEAMACELPIVSTDCLSGPRELLAPKTDYNKQLKDEFEVGEYGMLVPTGTKTILAEAMREMINNDALRHSYKSKLAARANEFDIRTVMKEYKQIFEDFLSSN